MTSLSHLRLFRVRLGNTKFTAGHKYSCAQVRVDFHVRAVDADDARTIVAADPRHEQIEATHITVNAVYASSSRAVSVVELPDI